MKIRRLSFIVAISFALILSLPALFASADKGGVPNGGGASSTQDSPGNSDHRCDGDPTGGSDSGHGANSGGYYDHHCTTDEEGNPSPSDNGSGEGAATGRPCEGCVGQADDKNPGSNNGHGQSPDETDHNNGYECDGNNGIARGNPAHTGCPTPPPPPPQCPDAPGCPTPPPPPQCPDAPGCPTPPPGCPTASACPVPSPTPPTTQVLGVKLVAGAVLPQTGSDSMDLAIVAVALIAMGAGFVLLSSRHGRKENLT